MTHEVSISLYVFGKESSYANFILPSEGNEARDFLQTELVKGHRLSVSHWQYEGRHGTASKIERAILDGRYDDAVKIGEADPVKLP